MILLFTVSSVSAQNYQYIYSSDCQTVQRLAELGATTEHHQSILNVGECYWSGPVSDYIFTILEKENLSYDQSNTTKSDLSETKNTLVYNNFQFGEYKGHFYLDEIYSKTEAYIQDISDLAGITYFIDTIGVTREGNPMISYNIVSNSDPQTPQILITSLMHAREAATATTVLFFLHTAIEELRDSTFNLFEGVNITFIPVYNPDGYLLNQTLRPEGGALIRKNVYYDIDSNYVGTDLNRNFGPIENWNLASDEQFGETYRGPEPFSEPETKAVDSLTDAVEYDIQIHLHSFSNVIVEPDLTGYPDSIRKVYRALGADLHRETGFPCGTDMATLNYVANGDIVDYMLTKNPNSIVVLPELGNQVQGFWPDIEDLPEIVVNGNKVIREYIELATGKFLVKDKKYSFEEDSEGHWSQSYDYSGLYHGYSDSLNLTDIIIEGGEAGQSQSIGINDTLISISESYSDFDLDHIEKSINFINQKFNTNTPYRNDTIGFRYSEIERIKPIAIEQYRDGLIQDSWEGDSLFISSFDVGDKFRVFFNLTKDSLRTYSDTLNLQYKADWNIRTRLDMLTIKQISSENRYITTPFTTNGIYNDSWNGFSQKIGMTGYHSIMQQPITEFVPISAEDLQYIELEYHATISGQQEQYFFNIQDIELFRYYIDGNTSVNLVDKDNLYEILNDANKYRIIDLNGREVNFTHNMPLIDSIKYLQDGFYMISLSEKNLNIKFNSIDGIIQSFSILD